MTSKNIKLIIFILIVISICGAFYYFIGAESDLNNGVEKGIGLVVNENIYFSSDELLLGKELYELSTISSSKEEFIDSVSKYLSYKDNILGSTTFYLYSGVLKEIATDFESDILITDNDETYKVIGKIVGFYDSGFLNGDEVIVITTSKAASSNRLYLFSSKNK